MAGFKNFLYTAFSPPYLLYTSTGVSAVIELIGDYLEQKVERVSPYDTGRGIRMTTTAIVAGPPYYFWYRMLDRRFPGRTSKIIFKKVLLDQTILSPVMIVAFYLGKDTPHFCCVHDEAFPPPPPPLTGMCRMEGKNHDQTMRELKDKFWFTYKVCWVLGSTLTGACCKYNSSCTPSVGLHDMASRSVVQLLLPATLTACGVHRDDQCCPFNVLLETKTPGSEGERGKGESAA